MKKQIPLPIQSFVLGLVSRWVSVWPSALKKFCAQGAAWFILRFSRSKRKTAYSNLRFAFPSLSYRRLTGIVKVYFGRFCLGALEMLEFYARRASPGWIFDKFEIRGMDQVERYRRDGRPLVFLSAHQGQWEGAAMMAGMVFPEDSAVLVKRQSPEWFYEALQAIRRAYSVTTFDIETEMLKAAHWLRSGKILSVVGDQGIGSKNPVVPFFGRTVPTPDAAFRLAVLAKAVVMPALTHRWKNKWVLDVFPPVFDGADHEDYLPDLESWNSLLTGYIRKHAADYNWGFKRWKYCRERNVLLLHDGTAGSRDRAWTFVSLLREGLSEQIISKDFRIAWKNAFLRLAYRGFLAVRLDRVIPFFNLFPVFFGDGGDDALKFPCQTIVCCGSEAVEGAVGLKRFNEAKIMALTKPPFWASHYVDLVIAAEQKDF